MQKLIVVGGFKMLTNFLNIKNTKMMFRFSNDVVEIFSNLQQRSFFAYLFEKKVSCC